MPEEYEEPEIWRGISHFPSYRVSTWGRVAGPEGMVKPYICRTFPDRGKPYVYIHQYSDEFRGPVVNLMLYNLFIGNKENIDVIYHDGDYKNLHIDNLKLMYPDKRGDLDVMREVGVAVLSSGMRAINRNNNRTKSGVGIKVVETGVEYPSVKACAEAIGASATNIYLYMRGGARSVKGYTFVWTK